MEIRQARKADILVVRNIINALQVSRKGDTIPDRKLGGFYEYSKSEDDLIGAINPNFVVAETDDGIRGFSLGYSSGVFRRRYSGEDASCEYKFILNEVSGNFLYVDMMGVLNPLSLGGGRFAKSLAMWNIETAQQKNLEKVLSFTCEGIMGREEGRNERSINFFRKLGFERFGGVVVGDGVLLGAYRLIL